MICAHQFSEPFHGQMPHCTARKRHQKRHACDVLVEGKCDAVAILWQQWSISCLNYMGAKYPGASNCRLVAF